MSLTTYTHPKILTILFLGFSSGLPRLLVASTLAAWLHDSGVNKAEVGLFAYVALPYACHFLWAPIIDHIKLPYLTARFGQRLGWMLLTQVLLFFGIVALGQTDPAVAPVLTALAALIVAFLSASQDVVIDAYRTEFLEKEQYGSGAAVAVFGYRVGMLVAGAGALALADQIDWSLVYALMSGFMVVGIVTALKAGEPAMRHTPIPFHSMSEWLKKTVIAPFVQFARAHDGWIYLLLFIMSYRMASGFFGFMATPFFLDIGFTKTEIAAVAKIYGFAATITGTLLGGYVVTRLGIWRALVIFSIMQICTTLAYTSLAAAGPELPVLMLVITADNLVGGAETSAAVAFLMRLCDVRYTATQYALLSSLATLPAILLSGASGYIAEHYGWATMFLIAAAFGTPALALLFKLKGRGPFATG